MILNNVFLFKDAIRKLSFQRFSNLFETLIISEIPIEGKKA